MAKKEPTDNYADFMKLFDPANVSKMFDPQAMMAQFGVKPGQVDAQDTIQKARDKFDAVAKANQAAAASYRDLMEKQMQIFRDVTSEAADQLKSGSPEDIAASYQQAVTRALEIMTELSDAARDANNQAYDVIKSEVDKTIEELKG
ncbi:phasin family protein [Sedimentitalea todarodis]|uniref:Phasin family protein n=1 Tax=Sedimentitalea todarodis TaxID=1631240 RepID=A0ABU3VM45_9RHOB|nr:phasin family protein [Sedimentitalea todarodis]MDU9007256.1 phasin family protein [Sedimentitalea todarodis]